MTSEVKSVSCFLNGDCLELMKDIPDGSIDMILCDLPYGVLNKANPSAKWDCVLPFDELWKQYKRVVKSGGAIVLFASGMFTAKLMQSAPELWRYNLVWKKGDRTTGFLNANRMPLRNHEDICIFYDKLPIYNPQMVKCEPHKRNHGRGNLAKPTRNRLYGSYIEVPTVITDEKYPKSVIDIQPEHKSFYHPTQKPVELLEWLIRTYTNPCDVVLDNCMGSGSTGVACVRTGRRFFGIELDSGYYAIAQQRLRDAIKEETPWKHQLRTPMTRPTCPPTSVKPLRE